MSLKPRRYFVEWEDLAARKAAREKAKARGFLVDVSDDWYDPGDFDVYLDADSLSEARKLARVNLPLASGCVTIYERANRVDVTPEEDGAGLLWDWERIEVEEIGQ